MMKRIVSLALCLILCLSLVPALADTQAQQLPVTGDMYGMLDLMDPYKTTISGLFEQPVAMDEETRLSYVYIGAENRQSEPFVMLLPDSSVTDINGAPLTFQGKPSILCGRKTAVKEFLAARKSGESR